MAIDAQRAVQNVVGYVRGFGGLISADGMRLEETEFDTNDGSWEITMSFVDNAAIGTRIYRTFFLDNTRAVYSMKSKKPF